ncbi:MAG: LytTR family DNA-binding domain-containing protein [Betaproteobacteria bacterium]|jgi:DNA-binding LytR/AlgR family response regulator|nr:LytTR family transcriptional regulator [Rhodocyclaceae bacterium]MCA3135581.1 LytTR family transcriptional regulator [Rhodocyclaceae bacterium]MCA3141556.1 LytTR family transcriptional regulator [Rhodocyclaceae bacterium]MCA3146946.1 LytTR family transcriptional regulator [Rhodocyclaceae bacterium]MCE2897644.1 LytTR family transcriptional regulator [Betaproteobacteria bacterium]
MTPAYDKSPKALALIAGGANTAGMLRYLTVTGLVLVALMTTLEPDVGFAAPTAARLLFWTLQISAGLLVLQSLLYLLTRRYGASRVSSWVLVLISGVLGAAVLAPVYWLIGEGLMEQWFGYPALPDDDGDDLTGVAFGTPLVEEFLDIVGPVTTTWVLICLPRLHWLVPPLLRRQSQTAALQPAAGSAEGCATLGVVTRHSQLPVSTVPVSVFAPSSIPSAESPRQGGGDSAPVVPFLAPNWLERLPIEIGTDVIAVASELQYLRVWTPRGCALILGALANVEEESAGLGLRVHRSWWVASRHVECVRRSATGAICLMSNGSQVPVSRRRRAEVLARFGDSAQYRLAAVSEAVTQTDLHR